MVRSFFARFSRLSGHEILPTLARGPAVCCWKNSKSSSKAPTALPEELTAPQEDGFARNKHTRCIQQPLSTFIIKASASISMTRCCRQQSQGEAGRRRLFLRLETCPQALVPVQSKLSKGPLPNFVSGRKLHWRKFKCDCPL